MGSVRLIKIQGKYYSIMSNNSPNRSVENNNNNRLGNSVRRCLFGKRTIADKQKESYLVKNYLGSITRQKSLKYNFDFENQKPLPGNFQWFEVPAINQTATPRSSPSKILLKVPATHRIDSKALYKGASEDEIENRLSGEKRGFKVNDENSNEDSKWSPLSCTTSNYNISNNHSLPLFKRSRNKVITDYFSKDLVDRPTIHFQCPLNPSISDSHAPSKSKLVSGKRKKVIQDYFPIKKVKARN